MDESTSVKVGLESIFTSKFGRVLELVLATGFWTVELRKEKGLDWTDGLTAAFAGIEGATVSTLNGLLVEEVLGRTDSMAAFAAREGAYVYALNGLFVGANTLLDCGRD